MAGVMYLVYRRVSQIITAWFSPDQYERSYPLVKFGLRLSGFVLIFLALIGPYFIDQRGDSQEVGREIYLLLDVSASMNTADLAPSRLEKARQAISALLPQLQGDRVGLILFTENAYVQCPLTRDLGAVSLFLNMAQTRQYTQTGTQFRAALSVAMDRFLNVERNDSRSARAIVLISDGEDFGDTYVSLLERMRQAGIVLIPVGIGSYTGGPVPHFQQDRQVGFKRYEDGTQVISRLEDTRLKELATSFGTRYVSITDAGDDLNDVARQLRDIQVRVLVKSQEAVKANLYQFLLFPALVCLLITMFLMPIRKI
jgi:Ca-activated chloride channel family protein